MRKLLALFAASAAAIAVLAVPSGQAIGVATGTITHEGTAVSPNGDGCMDAVRVPVTMSWPSDTYYYNWAVYATGPGGAMYLGNGGNYAMYGAPPTAATFTFNGGWLPDGDYAFRLDMNAYDSYWRRSSFSATTPTKVRLDRSVPSVVATGPAKHEVKAGDSVPGLGGVNVDVSTENGAGLSVFADFSEQIDAVASTLKVATVDGLPVDGSTSYDPAAKRLNFVPSTPMAGRYQATTRGVDTACNAGSASWEFTVASPPMNNVPAVPAPPAAPELPAPPATPELPPTPPVPPAPSAPEPPAPPAPPATPELPAPPAAP